jgi:polyisoprenoid-binding protein YceI
MTISKLGLGAVATAGALYAGTFNLDKDHSSVGFKVKHMMISNVKGKFNKFDGSFNYDEKSKKLLSLHGVIDANSISTENEKRDNHLRSADFFDVSKYPDITFDLTKVQGESAYGNLTMHGITKEIKLDYEDNGVIKDPWGNTRVGLALSGKINRKDFGLVYNTALEAGGVLIGDEVKLDVELEGILAK